METATQTTTQKKLQFKFSLQEISYGKLNKHTLIWDCPEDVDDVDSADDYLSHNMPEFMTRYDWGTVLDYKILSVGYDLEKKAEKKKSAPKEEKPKTKLVAVKGSDNDMFHQLQQQVFDYFADEDDKTVVAFIESFSYHRPAQKAGVGKMIEKFLKDNDLEMAYLNYVSDFVDKKSTILMRSAPSQRSMIEDIKRALFNLAFNRLRNRV